jgi:hypothetical protein
MLKTCWNKVKNTSTVVENLLYDTVIQLITHNSVINQQ